MKVNPVEEGSPSFHFPAIHGSCFRREVAAYLVYLSAVCQVLSCIALVFYLLKSCHSITITFELENIDILRGLDDAIHPALALMGSSNLRHYFETTIYIRGKYSANLSSIRWEGCKNAIIAKNFLKNRAFLMIFIIFSSFLAP